MGKKEFINKLAWLALIGAAALAALLIWAAFKYWAWVNTVNPVNLAAWASIATMALPLFFTLGLYFGKAEIRGMFSGFDRALDKGYGVFFKTSDVRDNSRIRVHNETRPAAPELPLANAVLPDETRFALRADTNDVIDV